MSKYVDTIGQILVDFVSRSVVPRHEPSGRGVKLAAIIYYDKYLDGEEVVVLPTVADDAREIQELLEEKFKYQLLSEDPNPNVLQSCQEKQLQNERNLVETFEIRLKNWKNNVDIGTIVDTFLIYFHGHGTEVLKNPCLLTRKWTAIPVDELVNLVTEVINPIHYCLVLDCCSNNYKPDEKANKRLDKANKTRAKDFRDRLITVSAAPSGHTATALKGKTLSLSPFSKKIWIKRFVASLCKSSRGDCEKSRRKREAQICQTCNFPTHFPGNSSHCKLQHRRFD